jgi:Zn-dependent M28 family amino/carboxypeptidase
MRRTCKAPGIRRTALAVALFITAFICVPATSAIAEVTYDPDVAMMIDDVTRAELEPVVNDLSGETQAIISGTPYTILTRASDSGESIDMAEQYVFEQLDSYGLDSVAYQNYPGLGAVAGGSNVIGQVNGTTKASEIVVIGAHLDDRPWGGGRAPGADDDASGVSAVLYLARAFADKTFERTIRFVLFGSEENAPWTTRRFGSGYYAYQAKQAGENIVAMIEADALAYNASRETPWIVEMHTRRPRRDKGGGDAAIASMWEDVIATYSIADLQPERYALSNRLSDHGSFWKWGYNAALLLEQTRGGSNPNWHTVDDTVYTFNWIYYEQVTKSLVGLAAHQAGISRP